MLVQIIPNGLRWAVKWEVGVKKHDVVVVVRVELNLYVDVKVDVTRKRKR